MNAYQRLFDGFLEKTAQFDGILGIWDVKERGFEGMGRGFQYYWVFDEEVKSWDLYWRAILLTSRRC